MRGTAWRPDSSRRRPKVLLVCHNHPLLEPEGVGQHTYALHETFEAGGSYEPILLARADKSLVGQSRDTRPIVLVKEDSNQYLLRTDLEEWDWLYGRLRDKSTLTRHYRDFLLACDPDIVQFEHTMFLGYDMIRVTRDTLPHVPIVYKLHDFIPICHNTGHMLRTRSDELCAESSPRRCHECYPRFSQQEFFMRKRLIQSHLTLVDCFVPISALIAERFTEWGIPRDKIRPDKLSVKPAARFAFGESADSCARTRFGFFGRLSHYKGIDVLLKAVEQLGENFPGHFWVYGAGLEMASEEFQAELEELISNVEHTVTLAGRYDHRELPKLLESVDWVVVPSIWAEGGPTVLLEAFQHGRPVICSNLGGMGENVIDGVNGLYFGRGDYEDLAEVLSHAATTPGLWEKLQAGIPPAYTIDQHAEMLGEIYEELLARYARPNATRQVKK